MDSKNNIHVVPSLGESVGRLWQKLQAKYTSDGYFTVSSPLSSTPLPVYDWIVGHKSDFPHWENVRFVLMDEMVEGSSTSFSYISQSDDASYERFARRHLWRDYHCLVVSPPRPRQVWTVARWQLELLHKRPKIEAVFDYLKQHMHLASSFPRSVHGYAVHYLRVLLGYQVRLVGF